MDSYTTNATHETRSLPAPDGVTVTVTYPSQEVTVSHTEKDVRLVHKQERRCHLGFWTSILLLTSFVLGAVFGDYYDVIATYLLPIINN